jgi:hypothetical protein
MKNKREYIYNFTDGGWNTEFATSKSSAINAAKKRWNGTTLQVDVKSFRVKSEPEYGNLMGLFN